MQANRWLFSLSDFKHIQTIQSDKYKRKNLPQNQWRNLLQNARTGAWNSARDHSSSLWWASPPTALLCLGKAHLVSSLTSVLSWLCYCLLCSSICIVVESWQLSPNQHTLKRKVLMLSAILSMSAWYTSNSPVWQNAVSLARLFKSFMFNTTSSAREAGELKFNFFFLITWAADNLGWQHLSK